MPNYFMTPVSIDPDDHVINSAPGTIAHLVARWCVGSPLGLRPLEIFEAPSRASGATGFRPGLCQLGFDLLGDKHPLPLSSTAGVHLILDQPLFPPILKAL